MTRRMSLADKSKLKSMMASKGLYFTDSQLEDIWQRNQQQQSGVGSSSLDQRIRDRQE